ncbi:MAG: glycerol-3-phosphate 1-O-acyltransferase PlsY [Bryobacterales bacterium]|nr:glycerol-3-phosphate 1-O-acyltransferase PlsY [Bryobacterales bacterium]
MTPVLTIVLAYVIGAVPFGFLVVKLLAGRDVRAAGSGNIGATNVLRTTGRGAGFLTLALDIGKGYLAVWLAGRMTDGNLLWMTLAALAVMAGHAYPVFLKFQGGKAVASFIGAYLCLTPLPLAAVLIVFVVAVAISRHVSLGSILAAGSFPFAVWLISHPPTFVVLAAAVSGGFIILRHKENLARLRAGTESVLSLRGKRA